MRIDFHTHILFDIDDGPTTIEGSVEMAQVAVADGTTTIVATPHAPGPGYRYRASLVHERVAAVREALDAADIPLEVVAGGELFFDSGLVKRLQEGVFLTCGGSKTVLVECPIYEAMPVGFEQFVFDLQVAGYRVVLAHPERITNVRDNPNMLLPLIERGVLMQLTSQALTGEQGQETRKIAETMVSHYLIHLIASDSHGAKYRPPVLSHAYQCAVELVGEVAATALVADVPRALLDDQPIDMPTPQEVPQRRRWLW